MLFFPRLLLMCLLTFYLLGCACDEIKQPQGEEIVNMLFGSPLNQNFNGCNFNHQSSSYTINVRTYFVDQNGLKQFFPAQNFTHRAGTPSPITIRVPRTGLFGILVRVTMPDCQTCCASSCPSVPTQRGQPSFVDEIFPADEAFTTFDVVFEYKDCNCCF